MVTATSPFGVRLRQWRQQRGLSRLGLTAMIGSTGRHLSFPETGRSRPSRRTVAAAARFDRAADRFFRDSAATATLDSHPSPPLK